MKAGRVLARCHACGAEAVSTGDGTPAVLTHDESCPSMPVLHKMSHAELWQFYLRMCHVIKWCKDPGCVEDALSIKSEILRDIRRRRLARSVR